MPRKSRRLELDALVIVEREHTQLHQLFREHAQLLRHRRDGERQSALVDAICLALSVHTQLVSEWLYPAMRRVARMHGARAPDAVALQPVQAIVARVDEMQPDDPDYADAVAQLGICARAHLDEVQDDIARCLQDDGLDTAELGRQMAQRLRELRGDVTRVGLPQADIDQPTWPLACRLAVH
jgi:hypothetical protein